MEKQINSNIHFFDGYFGNYDELVNKIFCKCSDEKSFKIKNTLACFHVDLNAKNILFNSFMEVSTI